MTHETLVQPRLPLIVLLLLCVCTAAGAAAIAVASGAAVGTTAAAAAIATFLRKRFTIDINQILYLFFFIPLT